METGETGTFSKRELRGQLSSLFETHGCPRDRSLESASADTDGARGFPRPRSRSRIIPSLNPTRLFSVPLVVEE